MNQASRIDSRPRLSSRPKAEKVGGLSNAISLLCAALREIFDESAYERYLHRNQAHSSPQAYAAFQREAEQASMRRPRCC